MNDMAQKDKSAEEQVKVAREQEGKAAVAHKDAEEEHGKQAKEEMGKSKA